MIKKNHKLSVAISLALAAIVTATDAIAQAQIEELVVTAQKRSQSVQDIPIAISGLSADDIEQLGFDDATDLTAQVRLAVRLVKRSRSFQFEVSVNQTLVLI